MACACNGGGGYNRDKSMIVGFLKSLKPDAPEGTCDDNQLAKMCSAPCNDVCFPPLTPTAAAIALTLAGGSRMARNANGIVVFGVDIDVTAGAPFSKSVSPRVPVRVIRMVIPTVQAPLVRLSVLDVQTENWIKSGEVSGEIFAAAIGRGERGGDMRFKAPVSTTNLLTISGTWLGGAAATLHLDFYGFECGSV